MSEKEPLISSTNKRITDDTGGNNNKRDSTTESASWLHYFGGKTTAGENEKVTNDTEDNARDLSVGFLQLFRYADWIDFILIFIGICSSVLHGLCVNAKTYLFGRLSGMFATRQFAGTCDHSQQSSSVNETRYNGCPLGIELSPLNYAQFNKFCIEANMTTSTSTITTTMMLSMSTFHSEVMQYVRLLFIVAIIDFIVSFAVCFVWNLIAKRQAARIRIHLLHSLVQRSIPYFDANSISELNDKLYDNVDKLSSGIGFKYGLLIAMLPAGIGMLTAAFFINWLLTLILLLIVPFIIAGTEMFSRYTATETLNELNTYSKASHIAQETFSSFRTVLSLNGGSFEQKRYEQKLQPTVRSSVRKGMAYGAFIGWILFLDYLIYAVGFVAAAMLMHFKTSHKPTISDAIVVVICAADSLAIFGYVGQFFQSIAEARAAAGPVFRLIDEAQDASVNELSVLEESVEGKKNIDMNGDIIFDDVNFGYSAREGTSVLRHLSLVAEVGKTTAIVGQSGCGKSTCLSLLLRFYEPSSGQITINGQSIREYNVKQLREQIGVVSQEPILFNASIYENIRAGRKMTTTAEIEEAARQANAHDFIMRLPNKYETLVGERGVQLSGGEKQRIAIARALVKQPAVLLLDEATSALDGASERVVQRALIQASKNRTTIVIAHRLKTIENADCIYVLQNGAVIDQGTHQTLVAKEGSVYAGMVRAQKTVETENDADETMAEEIIEEKDENRIFERSRLLSDTANADIDKAQSSPSSNRNSIYWRLFAMNKPEWGAVLIGCIACLASGASQSAFAYLLAKIISAFDDCKPTDKLYQVLYFCLIFLCVGAIAFTIRFLQFMAFSISGAKLTQRVRAKLFACLLRQEVAYFDRSENHSGAVCNRLSSDALAVQQMTGTRLGIVCEAIAICSFGLLFGTFLSWQLTLISASFMLILVLVAYMDLLLSMKFNEQLAHIIGQTSSLTAEVLSNMRTVKQFTMEKEVLRQYSKLIQHSTMGPKYNLMLQSLAFGIYYSLDCAFLGTLYWFAVTLVEQNKLAVSHLIIVFAFAIFALQSTITVLSMMQDISVSLSAVKSIFDLFDRVPAADNDLTKGLVLDNFRGEIEFHRVNFSYPSRPNKYVLKNFQMNIMPGQHVAVVGASGCGKSTIVQLLERFYDVTSGEVRLDGVDIRQLKLQWVRSVVGLVSQEPILFDLTIAENIAYGMGNVSLEDIIEVASKANIHQFIQQLPQGYETKAGMKGSQLSGGEKQRIAIARALLRRPKILLLDEVTSAMDSHSEQIVQQALSQVQDDDRSQTSVTIAHRLSTIRSCDPIHIIDDGHIMESGNHTELMRQRGFYYQLLAQNNLS